MFVKCKTNEFDGLEFGKTYRVEALGVNSYMVGGTWYGRSNFELELS